MLEKRIGMKLEPLGYAVEQGDDDDMADVVTVDSAYGRYTADRHDRAIVQTQTFGAHTRPELSMVLSFVRDGDTIVDVGAHIGTFAVPIKAKAGAKGRLFAFEANPKTFAFLQQNIDDNNLEGVLFNNGVSHKDGVLYLPKRKSKNAISDYLVEASGEEAKDLIEVPLIKLDDVVSGSVDLIKIDVEGMELDVLKSAEKTIDASRPIIYSEYVEFYLKRSGANPAEFEDFFQSRNYHFFINDGERNAASDAFKLVRVPGAQYIRGQVDFLMIPAESARYPSSYTDWYRHAPLKFLWARFRNALKNAKAALLPGV